MKRRSYVCSVLLNTTPEKLWAVLTQPDFTEKYMYNCRIITDLKVGSPVEWKGTFDGVSVYQKGELLVSEPFKLLKYSTIDPACHDPEITENYLHITYEIRPQNGGLLLTVLSETFDGDEERIQHAGSGWESLIFPKIKALV